MVNSYIQGGPKKNVPFYHSTYITRQKRVYLYCDFTFVYAVIRMMTFVMWSCDIVWLFERIIANRFVAIQSRQSFPSRRVQRYPVCMKSMNSLL